MYYFQYCREIPICREIPRISTLYVLTHVNKIFTFLYFIMQDFVIVIFSCFIFIFALILAFIGMVSKKTDNKFICKNCGKTFNRNKRLSDHLVKCCEEGPSTSAQNLICNICNKNASMETHQKKCVPGDFICEKCDKIFDRQSSLIKHREKHNETHECEICGNFFRKTRDLRQHKERANIFSCNRHCERRFCNLDALYKHERTTTTTGTRYSNP